MASKALATASTVQAPAGATAPAQAAEHVAAITGLRAIAVLAVLLFHIEESWMPGGFVGVDVFFVISGFVVAHSVMERQAGSYRQFVADFYRRRIARIFPAALAYIIVATTFSVLLIPFVAPTRTFEDTALWAVFGLSNFALLESSGDYFGVANGFNPFTHTWSLAVEEQYYLLFSAFAFPLLVHEKRAIRRSTLIAVAVAATASLAYAAARTPEAQAFAFYMLPTRFWELALGLLLRVALEQRGATGMPASEPVRETGSWIALLLVLWACWATAQGGFPYPGALLPCLASAALIACVWLWRDTLVWRLLASPVPLWIGTISYSLYLWHWGVTVFMRWTVGLDSPGLKLLAIALTFAMGWASYRFVEIAFRTRGSRKGASLVHVAGLAALAVAVCIQGKSLKPQLSLAAASALETWNPYSAPAGDRPCAATMTQEAFAGGLSIAFDAPCTVDDAPRLIVIGDSHAGAYQRMLWGVAETGRWDVRLLTRNGCGILNFRFERLPNGCEDFARAAQEEVARTATAGDVVFLSALHTPRMRDNWTGEAIPYQYADLGPRIVSANRRRIEAIATGGARVIVEDAKPLMPVAQYRCADWFNRTQAYCAPGSSVSRENMEARMAPVSMAIDEATRGLEGVEVWDPTPLLCSDATCEGYRDGKPLYMDADHLSGFGNDLLRPDFLGTIEP